MELPALYVIGAGLVVVALALWRRWPVVGMIGLGAAVLGGLLILMTPEPAKDFFEWHRYELGRETFFVDFPSPPVRESSEAELDDHYIIYERVKLGMEEGINLVAICRYSPDTGYTFSRELSSMTNKIDRTEGFDYAREIEAKVPAVEVRNHNAEADGNVILTRIYHSRFASLHLIASAPEELVEGSIVQRFLNSVEIPVVR
ncbi:MAG: hypothetical protein ACI9TH_000338 [Kiritimatiellia bacterium]|jgi:hypothetical protein